MARHVELIIDELAEAAMEQGLNADEIAERVRERIFEVDCRESDCDEE